jgi:hypothetical protein
MIKRIIGAEPLESALAPSPRQDRSGPDLQSAVGCRTIPRADGLASRIAAVRAHGVERLRISVENGAGSSGLFYTVRAWIARVGGVPLSGVRFFDPRILVLDLQVAFLDPQVTVLDPQVYRRSAPTRLTSVSR